MGVAFTNNWESVLDKLESVIKTEFGASLKTYRGLNNVMEGNQYLRIAPISSELVDYSGDYETREFSLNLFLYFKVVNAKKTDTDQVMRVLSRLETIIGNNMTMTLSDNTKAYNCRIESTEIDTSNPEEYLINLEYKCLHQNSSTTPTVIITAAEVVDGATSSDSAISLTFTLNRDSDNFIVGDIDVTNGLLSNFSGSGSVYTATFTPSAQGATTIRVLANKFTGINATGGNIASDIFNWTYIPKFISTWNTEAGDSGNKTVTLPLVSGGSYNFTVDWGDGSSDTITAYDDAAVTHTYSSVQTNITVTIDGTITGWRFNNGGHKLKLLTISNWGNLNISTNSAFYGCTNLTVSASNAPTISSTDLQKTFQDCTNFNGNIGTWDVSNVTNMSSMFQSATAFNNGGSDSIKNWNTSSVNNIVNLFLAASSFNQPIDTDGDKWDISGVSDLGAVFGSATSFNQDLNGWDVSNVTNMNSAFSGATSFNGNIASWNVSSVTTMVGTFQNTSSFNNGGQAMTRDGDKWNTSSVNNMTNMFRGSAFNQNIGNWDTSSLVNVTSMFQTNDVFNQDIGSWDMADVHTFRNMFYHADAFNNGGSDNIKNWDTSSGLFMDAMFRDAVAFNQPIPTNSSKWDVSKVTRMDYMFYNAESFNQDISSWNITSLTNATSMLQNANAWSNSYYDALLIAWEGQSEQPNVTFHAGDAVMTTGGTAEAARDALVANGWTITDSAGTHT